MVSKLEAEITAMQADFAGRMSWLRSNYLPDPLPQVVEDCLAELERRYDALRDMVEDQEATAAYQATRNQETIPDEIAGRLLAGENPIRVWREYRGLSLRSLAEQIGTSPSALSDMETGKSKGRPGNLQRIARILHVSMDELMQSSGDDANTASPRGGRPEVSVFTAKASRR
jgi:ribosome-binding protein aMBF1 (putative translation factor)